ncbi:MAG: D-beta-D-heptose 1-phosphate adenosyltransferase, partial [Thermobispora bispora]|nr:D-beta-D-heptose 1-phosphate adenosyltransferase [Thermobispora bispora]
MRGPVVVIGDCLLDVDLEGDASRLSPEAPVPVVEDPSAYHRPGGAGLAAALAARGGTEVVLITALGEDPAGHRLAELLPVDLVRLPLHGTTVRKVRVRARGQTLLRIDAGRGG